MQKPPLQNDSVRLESNAKFEKRIEKLSSDYIYKLTWKKSNKNQTTIKRTKKNYLKFVLYLILLILYSSLRGGNLGIWFFIVSPLRYQSMDGRGGTEAETLLGRLTTLFVIIFLNSTFSFIVGGGFWTTVNP